MRLGEPVIFNKLDCSDLARICNFLLARHLISSLYPQ